MSSEGFYLGGVVDPGTGDRTAEMLHYDSADLTTHGVIVGMTGSGKTGLGVIYLEEALLANVPTLILDPKGDMTNLLLTFPHLLPSDFEPWVDEAQASKNGKTVQQAATDTADLWRNGLASWDQDGSRIAALRAAAGFTVYTPGSQAGVPLNILGSLSAPAGDFDGEVETLRDEIEGFVSGLLGMVGVDADPISSREHILAANLIERSWRLGKDLDLAALLGQIQRPPIRKLGVFDVDTFFPEKDRLALAMKLNGLIASPAFATWLQGPPLDIQRLLYGHDDKPQAAIIYLAHLSEEERQFIVTLILSKVVTWMRAQAGTGGLRALVYMDEVFGFVPPTAQPPAKKPILTMLKQARAFGVGLLLSTQNPVDLDYKAMSNAGTWCIGRLQTERDKARILEALQSARGDSDVGALDRLVSGLGKRQFLIHNTREKQPALFTTRWAMSYLRGPLTRDEIGMLTQDRPATAVAASGPAASRQVDPEPVLAANESPVAPTVARGTPVYYLDAAAPWASEVGVEPGGSRLQALLAARVHLLYDDAPAKLKHTEEWEAVFTPLSSPFDAGRRFDVDYDARDFRREAPEGAVYILDDVPLDKKRYFTSASTAIKNELYRNRTIEIFKNPRLKLYSRVGEIRADFEARCDRFARDKADEAVAKLRDRLEARMDRLRGEVRNARRRVDELVVDVSSRRQQEVLDGVGGLLGGLLGGRRRSRSISSAVSRRSATRKTEQRLRTAEAKVSDKVEDLQDLEADLVLDVEEINDEWEQKATDIETVEIGLEKTDISIAELALVWVAVG